MKRLKQKKQEERRREKGLAIIKLYGNDGNVKEEEIENAKRDILYPLFVSIISIREGNF